MTRRKGAKNVPWDRIIARLRKQPGTWMVLTEMASVPYRTIEVIRRRQRPALRLDDGIIRCRKRAIAINADGDVVVTLALQFDPRPPGRKDTHGTGQEESPTSARTP